MKTSSENILQIFELCRSRERCTNCGNPSFYIRERVAKSGFVILVCRSCAHAVSLFAKTHLDNMKISPVGLYRIIEDICDNPKISSLELARRNNIAQKTAYHRKYLICSIAETIGEYDITAILKRLLSVKSIDPGISFKKKGLRKFTKEDIEKMKKLKKEGFTYTKIANSFLTDPSKVRKIILGELYANI